MNNQVRVLVMGSLDVPELDPAFEALAQRLHANAMATLAELSVDATLVNINDHPRPPVVGLLDGYEALMILGGGDVDPTLYGEEGDHANAYGVDRSADEYLIALISQAQLRGLPILGICRGSQIINVALGGTLIVDIEEWHTHRGPTAQTVFLEESVTLEIGSRLATMYQGSSLPVMNGHHQAVKDLGTGLVVAARATDGIVEGIEGTDEWIVGVQWHPEHWQSDPQQLPILIRALETECMARR